MHSVSVAAAVIRDDGKVLAIQRRDNAKWEPPGGVLELEETIEDGLRREVLEETHVAVEVEALTGVYKNMVRGIVALFFRCRIAEGTPAETSEAARVRWINRDEIEELMEPAYAVRVLDALAPPGEPRIRQHDGVRLVTS